MSIRNLAARLGIDPFLLFLAATVALAALLPARGAAAPVASDAATGAVALLFLLYGAKLSLGEVLAGLMNWRLQSLIFASTFILFPAVGLVLTTALKPWLPPALAEGLLFVCVLPSTVQSSIAFTSIARGNVPAALSSASLSNLVGMVVTPLLVMLLFSAHGPGLSLKSLGDIAMQLLLPFAAGQALRPLIGGLVARHRPVTSVIDRGSILVVVYAAFSEGMVEHIWSRVSLPGLGLVLLLDVAILAAILAATTVLSRWLGFSKEDEIAIVFCGSKKTLAGGIPMANILFAGQPVGLIVLPLMLFHQAQLFACATIAQRYARRPKAAAAAPVRMGAAVTVPLRS